MISAKKHAILLKAASVNALMSEALPKPGDRVLIINSGSGELPLAMLDKYKHAIDVVCTESSTHLLEMTKEKTNQFSNIKLVNSRLASFPFADNSFDIIITANDIEFVKNKQSLFREIKRMLKQKGYLFLTSYYPVGVMAWFMELDWRIFDDHYFGKVDRKKLSKLFKETGFKLLRSKTMPVMGKQSIFFTKSVKER
ncbi:MAG: class I SAM-dependent methyltransferase [Nanoarchaeota archaeon]|nr:class I SAM-dependent methyltransferase [Nanoarchaeota archaeon]